MSLHNPAPDRGAAILAELKTRAAALDFPLQLREHPWWVNWFADAEGHKLPTYKRKTGITKDQPGPFLTYGAACELDGAHLSFVPRPTNPLRCLDLDGCRDHATGELTPGARKVVDHFAPTYWEVSPSGRGLHGWLDAPEIAASFTVHVDGQKVEVFADTNHCTMTGTALDDCREVMRDPAAGDWLRLHADGETIPEGERDATFTRLAGGWFHDFEDADDFAAHCRERNLARCDPPMSKAQVDKIVKSILKREGKKADKNAAASADLDAKVTAFNATFGLVLNLGVVETRGTPIFHNVAKFRLFYQGERLGRQSIADAWLGHPQCRKYFDVVFDPTRAPFATVQSPRGAVFNLWPGFAVAPAEGDCTLFLSHVREIICAGDPERARWVENWLAHMVQRPEILPGTALVLRSAQGAGKTLVGEVLGKLLGDALFCEVSKASELTGDFNSHHQRKLLIMVEEAFWAGDKAAAGVLKHMITSPDVLVNTKFVPQYMVKNCVRLLITSNHSWIVPAGLDERRFCILDVLPDRKDDFTYFAALRAQAFSASGLAALHHHLRQVPLDDDLIRRPLRTRGLVDQQLAGLTALDKWIADLLTTGRLPASGSAPNVVTSAELYGHYLAHARNIAASSQKAIETILFRYLMSEECPLAGCVERRRVLDSAERRGRSVLYIFAPLSECRAAFARKLGSDAQWEGPDEWQAPPPSGGY